MCKEKKLILIVPTILLVVALTLFLPGLSIAGSLEPSDPPRPTMHTLDEIYQKVSNVTRFPQCEGMRFLDILDGTVADCKTDLIWTKDASCFYENWVDALNSCASLANGSCGLSDNSLPGDWRLPSIRELESLIDKNYSYPSLSNAQGTGPWAQGDIFNLGTAFWGWGFFWSASADTGTNRAWGLNIAIDYVGTGAKSDVNPAWCVRGRSGVEPVSNEIPPTWSKRLSSNRFVKALDDDGVVRDNETGLVWQKSLDTTLRNWNDAQQYCNNLNLGWRKGWRVPTVQELASLLDPSQSNPQLPSRHPFANVQSNFYWTATADADDTNSAWSVYMGHGGMSAYLKTTGYYVWCVRGGEGVEAQ